MKKILIHLIAFFLVGTASAQKEKFDIASFIPPKGWQRIDSNGVVAFFDTKTAKGQSTFCQLFLYPSRASTGKASTDFENEWNHLVVRPTGFKGKPTTEIGKADGWEVTTGYSNISQGGITFTCMLVTATGFGREMSVLVNVAGQDYMTQVQHFLNDFDLDSKAATSLKDAKPNMTKSSAGLNDYRFDSPERWFTYPNKDYILLSSTQSAAWGCVLNIWPSQPSSGNLEKDARNIYNLMYPGWQYRLTGEKKEDVSSGYTLQGLEYCMIEAGMQKQRPDGYYYDYEDGQALVINLGNQIAVITGRHNRGEVTCFCKHQYEYWRKFFNSFTVNHVSPQKPTEDFSKRIVGTWEAMGGSALTKYIFAANGRYQFIGAYSTTSRISRDMIEMRTSGFTGDGAYSIAGNKLTTISDREKNKPDVVQCRFEKVNHGGSGWKDRLYILDKSEMDGKLYEVCYEKENK